MDDRNDRLYYLHVDDDGEVYFREIKDFDGFMSDYGAPPEFVSKLPPNVMDLGGKFVLFRGRIVVPIPKEVVTKYEIPE